VLNKNIFNVSNPTRILDALWGMISFYKNDFSKVLIFLPSRRAIRSVERMIVERLGHAVVLPGLIPLGTGVEDSEDADQDDNVISNQERVVILSKLLSGDANIKNIATALPIARDFVRMQDYLNNEGIDVNDINWCDFIDDKYAIHFQNKARILDILKQLPNDRLTMTQKRNNDIRNWVKSLDKYELVIVCGSTASVPATADLMYEIAKRDNGRIILSGKISGDEDDFALDTNPYNAEYKFLKRLNLSADDVQTINVDGNNVIDVMNIAFGNSGQHIDKKLDNCRLIECIRESEEALVATTITKRAIEKNKSVLIITPDAAANQRIKMEMANYGIDADFSSGVSGTMTDVGRAILNLFDGWAENSEFEFNRLYKQANYNIFNMLVRYVDENNPEIFQPNFIIENETDVAIWQSIKDLSDILCKNDIKLNVYDARSFVCEAISNVSLRPNKKEDCKVCVLGTIESRMQTADVVILTGLNEGMFPALGYENSWLPRVVSEKIGLPSPDRKVSLMALDFMNLSCGDMVYWLRSKQSGGVLTTESRFLSRVRVCVGDVSGDDDILKSVRDMDNIEYNPLDYSPPTPPIDRSDVYVTEIELLIHNPYAFYAKHILKLRPIDDYWVLPDARNFGILVHDVIENATDFNANLLVKEMDARAREVLPDNSVLFYFWHKRFCEIALFIEKCFENKKIEYKEILGSVNIAGRNVRARADLIWDGVVMDIKTGAAPTKKQLMDGTMPQLALEGHIMQSGGFPIKMKDVSITPILQFLQLKNGDLDLIEYTDEVAQSMIDNTVQKVKELFGQYSGDKVAAYEYRESVGAKYHEWDDLARVDD
jgi:inactivated superfamily I helicase